MKFAQPAFLYALLAVLIPIIIHLFNFRRFRKVYFTNVSFLKEIKEQTRSKSQLKHLLVLASRILAVAFLALAFAQPFIPAPGNTKEKANNVVSIYLDNSFSMDAVGTSGRLLDAAKTKAIELASSFKTTDKFQLITNEFSGTEQRLVNKDELTDLIQEVKPSGEVKTLKEVLSRQSDVITGVDANSYQFILSDFQKNISDFENISPNKEGSRTIVPFQAQNIDNLFIDTCWFESPMHKINEPSKLFVRIKNISGSDFESIPLKFIVNGKQKALASFDVKGKSSVTSELSFTPTETGIQQGVLQITDFPIVYDDKLHLSFMVHPHIKVLAINELEMNTYLDAFYRNDPYFLFDNIAVDQLDYSAMSKYNLIILNGLRAISSGLSSELHKFVSSGGSLILFPGKEIELKSYNELCAMMKAPQMSGPDTARTIVSSLNWEHPVFNNTIKKTTENIDLPKVFHWYDYSKGATQGDVIMSLRNGSSFLGETKIDKGSFYFSSVPIDGESSNFSKHALFVIVLHRVGLLSIPDQKLFYKIGRDEAIETLAKNITGESNFLVRLSNSDFEFIPELRSINASTLIYVHDQIKEAGNYQILKGDSIIHGASFNYERKESNLEFFSMDELLAQIDKFGLDFKVYEPDNSHPEVQLAGIPLDEKYWKHCIFLVLVFLGIEIALLKLWK